MHFHRYFDKNASFILFLKKSTFFVFDLYLHENRIYLKEITIKRISEKFSTNSESFNEFGRGCRIDWWFPVELPICNYTIVIILLLTFNTQWFDIIQKNEWYSSSGNWTHDTITGYPDQSSNDCAVETRLTHHSHLWMISSHWNF